ncbi:MAG: phenylalanine--tRNA ligase subunit beta [Magnetococcales bacterium]|nr:phenylalanine--tRNA ligase subunit beta [Magnetococcales bacterium]NGZ05795.1 phenylalanine--tRNA ligase subunit beta [Magnetococcales bacterium]
MKLTLNWLRDHIDIDLDPATIGARLTMAGLELDALTRLDQGLEQIQVGLVETVEPHPNADRLTFCRVRVNEELLEIVCGAKNHRPGDKVAVARIGARLPNGQEITTGQIRGVTSYGMLCSVQELGLADQADGVLILDPTTPIGIPVAQALGRTDVVLELGITPNRGDCLGVRGVARELAALTGYPMRPLTTTPVPVTAPDAMARVHLEDPNGCPRYAGRIIREVKVGPSPAWLQQRLTAVGLRAINNIVDITNYLLLDLNQPLHAFDLNRLTLPVVVRTASTGETLRTLDGVEHHLTPTMTVIADQQRPLAIAGIMGGAESGVTETTTDIFLEAAFFDPITTTRTGRRLELHSESRYRFERGTDPEAILMVMEQATRLILDLAGGQAGPVTLVDGNTWQPPATLWYRPERVNRMGGVELTPATMNTILTALGCRVEPMDATRFAVTPPSWRHDLKLEEDLLEEIIRIHGYDQVPATLPLLPAAAPLPDPMRQIADRIRIRMVGMGYQEAVDYAFVAPAWQQRFNPELTPLTLLNPLSEEQSVLRTDLIVGLLESAQRNLNRGNHRVRLFELGRVFLPQPDGSLVEEERLACLMCGPTEELSAHAVTRSADLFDLKGDLEALLPDVTGSEISFLPGGPPFLHPTRKAEIRTTHGVALGWMGQLHPQMADSLDLKKEICLCELHLPRLIGLPTTKPRHQPGSRFPGIQNDFSFLMPATTPAGAVIQTVLAVDPVLIRQARVSAIYTGTGVPEGHKSLTLNILLQADDRTLTDHESKTLSERIIACVTEQFAAGLRG